MIDPQTGEEIELRSGAMPEDWHERNDTGYIPGGADKLAEAILSDPTTGRDGDDGDGWARRIAKDGESGPRSSAALPEGYGDEAARGGYDAKTGGK